MRRTMHDDAIGTHACRPRPLVLNFNPLHFFFQFSIELRLLAIASKPARGNLQIVHVLTSKIAQTDTNGQKSRPPKNCRLP
jgi:hypothetical protein